MERQVSLSHVSKTTEAMAGEKNVSSSPDVENVSEGYHVQKRRYWTEEIDTKRGDLLLLACCFVTGLLDCSTFRNWAIFVSMQTGMSARRRRKLSRH